MPLSPPIRLVVIAAIALLCGDVSLRAQSVCGNAVREAGEECDDGNGRNLDGCSAQCKFEQNHRINQLKMQFGTDTVCTANQLASAIVSSTVRSESEKALDNAVASGSTSILFIMRGLDDLSGTTDSSLQVGVAKGTPLSAPAGVTYDGTNDLDWWYSIDAADIDGSRVPTSLLSGSIAGGRLTAGPGSATLPLILLGAPILSRMSSLTLTTMTGTASAPLSATGPAPPGHLTSEHLDPGITSYATSGATITGELCGNVSAASLAATPLPPSLVGCNACSLCYTSSHTLLDLYVGGCTYLIFQQIRPTQPDTVDPNAPPAGAGGPYRLSANAQRFVTTCRDKNNATVTLTTCLDAAAYSSFYKFSTDRVIAVPACPDAPVVTSNGSICAGGTLQLTASGPSGTYQWAGPNGFTSTLQNPSIPNATTAASGIYSATVTLAGCTSQAGTITVTVNDTPATPAITAPTSAAAGATGLIASVPLHPASSYGWTITNGTITAGQGTNQITFSAGMSGNVGLAVIETNAAGCTSSEGTASVAIIAGLAAPQNFSANAVSAGEVLVSWSMSSGAVNYEIFRRMPGGTLGLYTTTSALSFRDTNVAANAAYLYMVRAVDASNNRSPLSSGDIATTIIPSDDPLVPQVTTVKSAHILELRTAIAAARSLAGVQAASFTDALDFPTVMKAIHIGELRAALDEARSVLLLPPLSYTDSSLAAGTTIKAAHVQELRNGVR
jgi:cysteine-rich repeat protein